MHRLTLLLPIGLLCAGPAMAAEAVIADPAASAACSKASGMKGPAASAPLRFSDQMGRTALILSGTKLGTKGKPTTMLCLYDRHSGRAEARSAEAWSKPPRQ